MLEDRMVASVSRVFLLTSLFLSVGCHDANRAQWPLDSQRPSGTSLDETGPSDGHSSWTSRGASAERQPSRLQMVSGIRAQKYAAMDARSCAKALALRGVPFAYGPATRGVNAPIRLTGKIRGVDFHAEPLRQRATSPFEILDCRLALALDDLAVVLTKYDIVETVHMSMYRPPGGPLLRSGKHSQHEIGMAIDIGHFVRRDGTKLVVESDWHGDIGDDTCGDDGQPHPPTERAKTLRSILCKAADERMFNLYLTPNYNTRHKNHFHLEVTRSARWFIVH